MTGETQLQTLLEQDDEALEARWQRLQQWLHARFGQESPGLESILFLIGIQSQGQGYQPKLKKEVKQDLIMEGTCCVFETLGLYARAGADDEGRWIWAQTGPPLPPLPVERQEKLLRIAILRYFEAYLP